jgi:hypothetical protein
MALLPVGTKLTTSLSGLVFQRGGMNPADTAALRARILDDKLAAVVPPGTPNIWQGAFEQGQLYIPRRGVLKIEPGDVIAVDAYGWPILISHYSIAAAATSWDT